MTTRFYYLWMKADKTPRAAYSWLRWGSPASRRDESQAARSTIWSR